MSQQKHSTTKHGGRGSASMDQQKQRQAASKSGQARHTSGISHKSSAETRDAIALLKADHEKVQQLFQAFEEIQEEEDMNEEKAEIVEQICMELSVHAQIEEEIFYPAVRNAIKDRELMDEADVEHESAKHLIAQLEAMEAGDDHYDAKVCVLGELVNHHIKEEQNEMFAQVKKSDMDLQAVGEKLMQRKEELMANFHRPPPPDRAGMEEKRRYQRRQAAH